MNIDEPTTDSADDSASTALPGNSTRSGRFLKGKSGNPSGRPKVEGQIRDVARAHGPAAIRRLVQLMRSKNERVAVTACQALLDRGFGRPPQSLEHTGKDGSALVAPPIFNISFDDGGPGMPADPIEAARIYQEFTK